MKITADTLARFVDLPREILDHPRGLRDLLDDLGIEVKREAGGVYTLELLANRGDHHCVEGIAREISARFDVELRQPSIVALTEGDPPIPLRIETDLCLVYTATWIEGPGGGSVDGTLLEVNGMASILAPVDATNLANLELGQPTHAFDADKIVGGITVRLARPGERAWLLFEAEAREIPAGTMVIADDTKILAVAGVIGCEDSKTTEATTRVLLESATFDPVAVRKASRALGIHTDASARFERGADPARPLVGAGRVAHLLQSAGWRVRSTGVVSRWGDPARVIPLTLGTANAYLGLELTVERVNAILGRLGFTLSPAGFRVPTWRLWDVENVQDVYEELAKIAGYETSPATLPPIDHGALPTERERRKAIIEEVLTGSGAYEVFTDGFHGRPLRDKLLGHLSAPESHPLWTHVETTNALDRAYSLLKNNGLAQALDAVEQNLRVREADYKLYELTRTFHPPTENAERLGAEERGLLWLIAVGTERPRAWADRSRPADVYWGRALVAELAVALGIDLQIVPGESARPIAACLHPKRQVALGMGPRIVGALGEVHPAVLATFKIKGVRPLWLEIDVDRLYDAPAARPAYAEPPTAQPIERSLAFTLPHGFEAGEVARTLAQPGIRVAITDLFAHEEDGKPVRTVTYALSWANADGKLSADAVNAELVMLTAAVVAEHGVKLRGA